MAHRPPEQSAASGSDLCPDQLDVWSCGLFAVAGERNPFDGRVLFPGLLVQSLCHDDGYVCVCVCACLKIVLLFGTKPASSVVRPTPGGMFFLHDPLTSFPSVISCVNVSGCNVLLLWATCRQLFVMWKNCFDVHKLYFHFMSF